MSKILKIVLLACLSLLVSCSKTGMIDSKSGLLNFNQSNRSFSLTLLGGGALNKTDRGIARPVLICIYLVKGQKWLPPLIREEASCIEKSSYSNFIHTSRILLPPNGSKLIDFEINPNDDYWVVLDADFSKPEIDYVPYIFKIGQRDVNLYVHIDGSIL